MLPRDLVNIVLDYLPDLDIPHWIYVNRLHLSYNRLSGNPSAISLIKEIPEYINWELLSTNPAAIDLLIANQEKINWKLLSRNPAAIELLEKNFEKINWYELGYNTAAIHLLKDTVYQYITLYSNPAAIEILDYTVMCTKRCESLSTNPAAIPFLTRNKWAIELNGLIKNPAASELIKDYLHYFTSDHWYNLSKNPGAVSILEANLDKISWGQLNCNPAAVHILLKHPKKINWYNLSSNPGAMDVLEANQRKINWIELSNNPGILTPVNKAEIRNILHSLGQVFRDPKENPVQGAETEHTL